MEDDFYELQVVLMTVCCIACLQILSPLVAPTVVVSSSCRSSAVPGIQHFQQGESVSLKPKDRGPVSGVEPKDIRSISGLIGLPPTVRAIQGALVDYWIAVSAMMASTEFFYTASFLPVPLFRGFKFLQLFLQHLG